MNSGKNASIEAQLSQAEKTWLRLTKQAARRSPPNHIVDCIVFQAALKQQVPAVYQLAVAPPAKPKRTYLKKAPAPAIRKGAAPFCKKN